MVAVEQSLREQVAWACRILADEGYADLTLGHVSARAPAISGSVAGQSPPTRPNPWGEVLIKRKGVALDEVGPDDVVEADDATAGLHLETVLHTAVYERRPDVGAVVHGHPPYVTAFSATDARLELLTHDAVLFADGIAVFDETPELITEDEQGRAVAEALGERRVVVLRNHGVLVADRDVRWAVLSAVTLERALRLQSIASTLGPLRPISQEWAERMFSDKYQDRFVEEYWQAWIRKLRRAGADGGMPSP